MSIDIKVSLDSPDFNPPRGVSEIGACTGTDYDSDEPLLGLRLIHRDGSVVGTHLTYDEARKLMNALTLAFGELQAERHRLEHERHSHPPIGWVPGTNGHKGVQ